MAIELIESNRDGAVRTFSLHIPSSSLDGRVSAALVKKGQSVRLPGFRPGKIPIDVLRQRYGAAARKEAIQQIASEAKLPDGGLFVSLEITAGGNSGDVAATLVATYLHDLPDIDFSSIALERLVLAAPDTESENAAAVFLQQQLLDRLDQMPPCPIPP